MCIRDRTYTMQILPGAFTDDYGHTNDTINSSININSSADFGNLKVLLEDDSESPKIIQLLNANSKVLKEKKLVNNSVFFNHLIGGTYKLKLIYDLNENGKWDTGNYLNHILPERTLLFDENINIRANWDKEIEWQIIEPH